MIWRKYESLLLRQTEKARNSGLFACSGLLRRGLFRVWRSICLCLNVNHKPSVAMFKSPLVPCLAVFMLSACAVLQGPDAPEPVLTYAAHAVPAVGEVRSAAVGDILLTASYGLSGPALQAAQTEVLCRDLSKQIEVPAGRDYVLSRAPDGQDWYCGRLDWVNSYAGQERTTIDECMRPLNDGRWALYFNDVVCPEVVKLSTVQHSATSDDARRQELVFSGRSGSQLFLQYVEVRGDAASAQRRDVRFDIADDPVVGIEGARIEILELNSMLVRYRVLSGFE